MDTATLWNTLSKDLHNIEFSVGGEASELPAIPGLVIEGIGDVSLPLLENSDATKSVVALCRQAPFGKGMETVVDTSVRKSWELEPLQFSFTNPDWNEGLQRLLLRVGQSMGCAGPITCYLYKLLVYEVGGHFLFHRDTEKEPGMFATMVVQLPSKCTGGNLVVKHKESAHTHDFGQSSGKAPFMVHFAAHFADLEHKVEEVLSGIRVAVVYNVCWAGLGPAPSATMLDNRPSHVASILDSWDSDVCEKLVFCLDHQYTEQSISNGVTGLKGIDRVKLNLLLAANNILNPDKKLNLYLALAERQAEFYSLSCNISYFGDDYDDDDNWELSDDTVTVSSWVNVDGSAFSSGKHVDVDFENESLNDPWSEDAIVENNIEGYTGNAGPQKSTVYHQCIVVIWPAQREVDIILQHGGVSAGVHFLQSMADKFNQQTDSKQRVEEIENFRVFFARRLLPILQQNSTDEVSKSVPSVTSALCQVSDVVSTRLFLSGCISKYGLSSGPIASSVISIGDKFGWSSVIDLILPLFSDLKSHQVSFGVEVFVRMAEMNQSSGSEGVNLNCHFTHLLSLILSPEKGCKLFKLADICLKLSDLPSVRQWLSHVAKLGVFSLQIADAIIRVIHHFGSAAVFDLIPGVFSVLCGAAEEACGLLATLLIEYRDAYGSVLVPILGQVIEYLVKHGGKKCADHLSKVISGFKDVDFDRKVILEVLLPIGLCSGNSIVADMIIAIGHSIGWSSVKDLVPAFFDQLNVFCAQSCSPLLASLLQEDVETGRSCCSTISLKVLSATSLHSLPGKDLASLILDVFQPLGDIAALTQLVSSIIQHSDAAIIADLVACLRIKVTPALLKVLPLASIVKCRIKTIVSTIKTISVPSWQLPNASTMPNHYVKVLSFLRGTKDTLSLHGFQNIADARKFIQRHRGSLPVSMCAGGAGSKAFVQMGKTSEVSSEAQKMDRLSLLNSELKGLSVLVSGTDASSEITVSTSATQTSSSVVKNTSSHPSSPHLHPVASSQVNCSHSISLVVTKPVGTKPVASVMTPPAAKRMKTECIELD